MSLISSIRSGTSPPPDRDRASEDPTSPPAGPVGDELPLPRHLLVALAGVAADVTSLRQRVVGEPQLQQPLDRILARLDGLVDSIYERAADSRARPVAASSGGSTATTDRDAPAGAVPAGSDRTERRANAPSRVSPR